MRSLLILLRGLLQWGLLLPPLLGGVEHVGSIGIDVGRR